MRRTFIAGLARSIAAFMLALVLAAPVVAEEADKIELIMFEEFGCEWCELWLEEIGPVYPLTPEGRFAPLRRVWMHDERPEDLKHISRIAFSPTFVVVRNGEEAGRLLGYPGEDFFWPMLDEILAKAGYQP
jgi:thioredoxin-related protein